MHRTALLILSLIIPAIPVSADGVSPKDAGFKPPLHHDMTVTLDPERHAVTVTDRMEISVLSGNDSLVFFLHPELRIHEHSPSITVRPTSLETIEKDRWGLPDFFKWRDAFTPRAYVMRPRREKIPVRSIELRYSGRIHHPIQSSNPAYARSFSTTPGIIAPRGVYLANSSLWIPRLDSRLSTFEMVVDLPEGWKSLSQGERVSTRIRDGRSITRWKSSNPGDEIFLVAGRWKEYSRHHGNILLMALLRTPDRDLAERYLEATGRYIAMYEALIDDYPYAKFALVENFWETGYGMPSFTLLGPRVIRFPFILHSSYPHELLHNWWGNGVFVSHEKGNWCEGITAYMADHLIKEQMQQGRKYRRSTLQNYRDYVAKHDDFPLRRFHSRRDAASAAVGYGKALMVYHMLRRMMGDEPFLRGWRRFYRNHIFTPAGFHEIRKAFERVSGKDLNLFFSQWIDRTGAPELRVAEVETTRNPEGYRIRFLLHQVQPGAPYSLNIPLALQCEGDRSARLMDLEMNRRRQAYDLNTSSTPLLMQVDPGYDLFRRLHHLETPPALSKAFGSSQIMVILPGNRDPVMQRAYRNIAEHWRKDQPEHFTILSENEIETLPNDRTIWVFDRRNRWRRRFSSETEGYPLHMDSSAMELQDRRIDENRTTTVLVARHPDTPSHVFAYLSLHDPEIAPPLIRKLPHYGKYGYLAFEGAEARNVLKGEWPLSDSPLIIDLAPTRATGAVLSLPREKPLIERRHFFDNRNN